MFLRMVCLILLATSLRKLRVWVHSYLTLDYVESWFTSCWKQTFCSIQILLEVDSHFAQQNKIQILYKRDFEITAQDWNPPQHLKQSYIFIQTSQFIRNLRWFYTHMEYLHQSIPLHKNNVLDNTYEYSLLSFWKGRKLISFFLYFLLVRVI